MSGQNSIVGSWTLTVHEADGPPTRGLCTFGADGTMVVAEHPVVTPPGTPGVVFTSSGHGAWTAAGPDGVACSFTVLGSNATGMLCAVVTFRGRITLNRGGMTFTGDITAAIDDPEGAEIAVFPLTLEGRRIVAEAPHNAVTARQSAAVR